MDSFEIFGFEFFNIFSVWFVLLGSIGFVVYLDCFVLGGIIYGFKFYFCFLGNVM